MLGKRVKCPLCGHVFRADVAPPPEAPPPPDGPGWEEGEPPTWVDPQEVDHGQDPGAGGGWYEAHPSRPGLKPHRGAAVLVLGILSLVTCYCAPIFGPIAWFMGEHDLRRMRAGRMDRSGESVTNAGRICGMIATVLFLAGVAFFIVFAVLSPRG
jgi:hypothetical protein